MSVRSRNIAVGGVMSLLALRGVQCTASGNEDAPVGGDGTESPDTEENLGGDAKGGSGGRQGAGGDRRNSGGTSTTTNGTARGADGGQEAGTNSRAQSTGVAGTTRGAGGRGAGGGGVGDAGPVVKPEAGRGGSLGKGGASETGGSSSTGIGGAGVGGRSGSAGSSGDGGIVGPSTGDDGCTDAPASNLTLQQIALYQSVKIPLVTDGTAVALSARVSGVIAGRQTLFRAFVTPGSGWTARELSARLTLTSSSGNSVQYSSKKTISKASTESDRASTFEIMVPATGLTEALRYSLQIVECGSQSGTAGQVRFPATGDADLGVKKTGGLKIKVIPLQVNNLLPDTSQTALDGYAKEMMSMYPIDAVDITVGDTLTAASPVDWTSMADQIRAKRQKDNPAADYYYFGLVKPASTLTAYCKSSCTLGIGLVVPTANTAYARAAVGVGFGEQHSWTTMAHEIGHNHGREHSPCAPNGLSIAEVDSNYPYSKGVIGVWGWDKDKDALFDPAKGTDIMGYCDNQWISDYTYNALVTRVAAVNGAKLVYAPANTVGKWRVLLVNESQTPRWGVPITEDTAADGSPETATIYNASGMVLTTATVYRIPFSDISASMVLVPEPAPDWYAVEVQGSTPHSFTAPITVPAP